jgi:hypothetical protein
MKAIITTLLALFTLSATADIVKGRVVDSETKEPLPEARLTMDFNDILNNEDGRWSQQTAYQQTTSWSDFRHHYVGINFTYHLDAKKKD